MNLAMLSVPLTGMPKGLPKVQSKTMMVSVFSGDGVFLQNLIWNTASPLGIGYPLQWAIEQVTGGVRVLQLFVDANELQNAFPNAFKEEGEVEAEVEFLSHRDVESGKVFVFKRAGREALRLQFHSVGWEKNHISNYLKVESISDLHAGNMIFKKALKWSVSSLIVILGILMIIPVPQPTKEELIPPQFTKLILRPASSGASSRETQHTELAQSSRAHVTAIVNAFHSKTVQRSLQHLFKGGVLPLLAKSNLMSKDNSVSTLSRMLQEKDAKAHSSEIQMAANDVKVGSLGGAGSGGVSGYGQGEHAGISGQGKGFVSLETAQSSVEEGLTKDEVGKVIHEHLSEVRYCYEAAILRSPDLQGKLMVEFVIGGVPGGQVKTAKVNSITLGDQRIGDCIVSRLAKWNFPKPRGGVDVAVNYPFVFKTLGR